MKKATKNTLRRWILREYPEVEIIESGMFDETLMLKGDREEQLIIEDGWLYTKDSKYALSDTDNIDQAITIFFWSNIIKLKEFNRTRRTYREFLEDEGLDLEIVPFDCLPCSCRKFVVNGIDADVEDFGDNRDFNREIACPYGCGDHHFEAYPEPKPEVLEKYKITEKEYNAICNELTNKLYVGGCGWCE